MDESQELEAMNEDKNGRAAAAALLLENLRSCEDREFEKIAKRALEGSTAGAADIDAVHPHPLNKTLLDVACCEGRASVVETLLRLGANVNRVNEFHDRAPLHFAAEAGHSRVLEILLNDPRTDPNVRAGQQTALHLAVRKNRPECVRLLLEKGRADPNVVNSRGLTPIHLAASAGQREMVLLILGASTRLPPDLDNFRDFRKLTTRDVLLNKMPDIELPPPLPTTRKRPLPRLVASADTDDEESRLLKSLGDANEDEAIEQSLETAARRNFPRAAKQMLARRRETPAGKTGEHPRFGEAAARVAVELGHPEVLREILAVNGELADRLLIPACQELGVPTWPKRDDSADDPRLECLRLIMERQTDVEAARREDDKGNTPLHYAARAESLEAVRMLLRSANCYLGHRNVFGRPPLAHLSSPVLSDFFDECLRAENERTDDFEIEFDYRCLVPSQSHLEPLPSSSSPPPPPRPPSEMDTLAYIAENRGLKNLLKHPLLSSFLYIKWHRVRYFFYANFIFYVFFYLLVNAYVLSTNYCPSDATEPGEGNATTANATTDEASASCQRELRPLRALATVALVLLAIREILQFVSSPWRYVSSSDNFLEVGLVFVAGWTIVAPNNPQIGAVLVLVSAWELVLLMGQHPSMSIGIEMFKTVSLNFARFLFLYAFLILAFALAFFTLFKDETNFPDPGRSLFKTIIMLTGEFDASDIPFVSRPVLGHFIFLLFVFLIAIVLFNLLNGLAVNDTADIINRSELVALVSRVRLVSYAESVAAGLARCSPRVGPVERTLLLFPDYLPRAKIAVSPCKSNRIRVNGKPEKRAANCSRWSMDASVVERARRILARRGEITENEKTMVVLEAMRHKLERLEIIVDEVRLALARNAPTFPPSLSS